MTRWLKDLAFSLLWCVFDPWPMQWPRPQKKQKNKKKPKQKPNKKKTTQDIIKMKGKKSKKFVKELRI